MRNAEKRKSFGGLQNPYNKTSIERSEREREREVEFFGPSLSVFFGISLIPCWLAQQLTGNTSVSRRVLFFFPFFAVKFTNTLERKTKKRERERFLGNYFHFRKVYS